MDRRDWTRGDDPVYDGFREGWTNERERELQEEVDRLTSENSRLGAEVERLGRERETLRNELCLKCGLYREAHKGACDWCRWRK